MKILTINTNISSGGAAKIARTLHDELNKTQNITSYFISGYGVSTNKYEIILKNKWHKYLSALSFRLFSKELNTKVNLESHIKKCDVIHLHNLHGYYLDYVYLFELIIKYDKPVIWTLHDIWSITGRCAIATECLEWKSGCRKCSQKELYPKTFLDRANNEFLLKKNIYERLNERKIIIVTPSRWLKEWCKDSILRKFEIINISNGIDYPYKYNLNKDGLRKKHRIPLDKKVVLFIAANPGDKLKGMPLLYKAIEELEDVIFISIGKKIDLEYKNLYQLGYIADPSIINEIFKLSDVYVNPSLSENFPTTILEAFSCKIPVIGFKIGGIREQLEENCGVLVEEVNDIALLNNLKQLLEDEEKMEFLSENAYKKYLNNYTFDRFVEKYIDLYNKINI